MISLRTFGVVLFAGSLVSVAPVMAQQSSPDATQLALEVRYYPNEPPAYQTVHATSRAGAWYARFGHVRGWSQPPDAPAVSAVNIKSELAEDGVRVWVSVFLGELHEQEKNVSSYILHEGEQARVAELSQVGVEPFDIKLIRVIPSLGDVPQFNSKAKAIELVTMQPNASTLPSYKVVFRNASNKNVSALEVRVLQAGQPQLISMPQGKEGQPLILQGGMFEFVARLATRAVPGGVGYAPTTLANQVVEVSTAIFDDGTFEGDSEPAITFAAFQKGRKIQLERILKLLGESLTATAADPSATLTTLKNELSALNLEADPDAVQEVLSKYPGMPANQPPRVKITIEVAMKSVKTDVLNDITEFSLRNRRVEPYPLHNWLATLKQRYEAWVARL